MTESKCLRSEYWLMYIICYVTQCYYNYVLLACISNRLLSQQQTLSKQRRSVCKMNCNTQLTFNQNLFERCKVHNSRIKEGKSYQTYHVPRARKWEQVVSSFLPRAKFLGNYLRSSSHMFICSKSFAFVCSFVFLLVFFFFRGPDTVVLSRAF